VRPFACAVVAAGLLFGGCDESNEPTPKPPAPDGPPEVQIVAAVNGMFDAWNEGDGELACAYMTEGGQRLAVRIAPQFHELEEPIDPDTCPEAVEQSAEISDEPIGQVASRDRVELQGKNRAIVHSEFRGALTVKQVAGEWLVAVPTFID
jgi:hypothetical protein